MSFSCRICGNSENNRVHRAREMMFGTRDTFEYVECGGCGTLQIAEIPSLASYYPKEYFSFGSAAKVDLGAGIKRRLGARFAGEYLLHGRNYLGKLLLKKKPWIRDHFPASLQENLLGIEFDSRILDFGCGSGRLLQALHYFGFRNLTGADAFIDADVFYPTGVKIYKRHLVELDAAFDLVMLHHSFEHLPDPLESLQEIHRLLAPGGHALLRIPVLNFAWEKYSVNWVQLDPPRHLFLYTENGLQMLAEKAGLEIEKIVYDSSAFQFWGSEQYLLDIPLNDPRSHNGGDGTIFSTKQITEWQSQAEELNAAGNGDQACFYFRKK